MDTAILVDSNNVAVGDGKKGARIGGAQRNMLSDISNLQNLAKQINPDAKNKGTTITTKDYVDKLEKENVELTKLLADRNKLIAHSVVELRKLRVNLQKVQLQNSQLAQANNQMLAELNSGKDRLKVVQHELGCKNGLLIARKVEAGERGKIITCLDYNNEAGSSHHDETAKSSQADKETKPSFANQRKQSRNQSLGRRPVKAVCAKEEVNKRRSCSRRQSARLKSKGLEETEGSFPMDNAEIPVSSTHDDQIDASGQTIVESSTKKEDEENDIPGSEDLGPPAVKAFEVREETEKKRRSRRQSATFKTEESEATEESYEIDAKYHVSSLHDDEIGTSGQTFSELSVKKEYEGNATVGSEGQELRRSSVGRPLRRAAVKVQSYKEIPLNIKMRRME